MTVTVTLPDKVAYALLAKASEANQSLDEYVTGLLSQKAAQPLTVHGAPDVLNDVVAQIRALPPRSPSSIQWATASLHDLLVNAVTVTDFDEEAWSHAWAEVEAEANTRDQQDTFIQN